LYSTIQKTKVTKCWIELCAAAAADRMSASRRRRFHDVFTSCCTLAICC